VVDRKECDEDKEKEGRRRRKDDKIPDN